MEIREKLQEIFREVCDDDSIVIGNNMTVDDMEDWDSLSHITLIHEIEAAFGIRFTTREVVAAKNVGEFIHILESKVKG